MAFCPYPPPHFPARYSLLTVFGRLDGTMEALVSGVPALAMLLVDKAGAFSRRTWARVGISHCRRSERDAGAKVVVSVAAGEWDRCYI